MRESAKTKRARSGQINRALAREYPDATCALEHKNALELLVATILSAQCTDQRVNIVTPALFRKYKSAKAYAKADPGRFEQEIRSTGFFRNKTKSILGTARMLVRDHGGKVPDTMEALVQLPGVARKTANVVLGTWFGKASGVTVDTHVHRISGRLKLSSQKDPNKVELDLMKLFPKEEWVDFSHRTIWHGRRICQARKPKCAECPLEDLCPSAHRVPRGTG